MTTFVKTRLTLLTRLADGSDAAVEAAWARFFDMYHPAMLRFVEAAGGAASSEDIVQRVMVKLVKSFNKGRYRPQPGVKFRSYLCRLLRNELVDWWRNERVRDVAERRFAGSVPKWETGDPGKTVDALWRLVRHETAVNIVMTRMAFDERAKAAYRAHVMEGRPKREVLAEFGLTPEKLAQTKCRIERRIAEVEKRYMKE